MAPEPPMSDMVQIWAGQGEKHRMPLYVGFSSVTHRGSCFRFVIAVGPFRQFQDVSVFEILMTTLSLLSTWE